jgi:hypothetical protein
MKHLLLINNAVTSEMVRKEEFQGEMHYMIASATMPDDIVMNGGLYPAEEIAASFTGLEEVHAPVGHPVDVNGNFISATTPYAVRNNGIGAQVANVRRENGRVFHDTAINIEVAKSSNLGKRVLDRVEAIMSGDNAKPIHTSTGVYLERTDVENDSTMYANRIVEPHDWVGSNFFFDHNAILLDEDGAATPEQGTGMAVNKSGEQVKVLIHNEEGDVVATQEGDIIDELYEFKTAVREAIKSAHFAGDNNYCYIVELHESYVILENYVDGEGDTLYKVPYMVDSDGGITSGTPQKIKRNIVYTAINSMKTFMKSMGFASNNHEAYNGVTNNETPVEENDMNKEEMQALLAEQSKTMQANLNDQLASSLKPLQESVKALEANAKAGEQIEKDALIAKSGLSAEIASEMSVNALKAVVKQKEDLEANGAGEFGERTGSDLNANSKGEKDEWEGYDLNANMEAK